MNKLNIKEANDHLKQLHRKVFELENQVQMHALHTQELERSNRELQERLEAAQRQREEELAAKDAQITELSGKLSECESQVQVLLQAAEERDVLVLKLESKARLFYEAVEHRAALGRIVQVMDDLHHQREESAGSSAVISGAVPNGSEVVGEKGDRTLYPTNGGAHLTSTSDIDSTDIV